MSRSPLPPALERRALTLVDELVDTDEDLPAIDALLGREEARVRARVQRLLGLARTVDDAFPTVLTDLDAPDLPVPERVGAFALVAEIARGGMGAVWRGERADGLFEQTVAVKLLRTSAVLLGPRFAAERRILARLDHPNIARLIDGGVTAEDVPWLVMEYAPGRHIDVAAAAGPIANRVRLFVEAARAVQFAHTRLVVHADLKPSNIVVAADGQVKLLDFGVARLIGDDETASHPMTPAFASPARRAGAPPSIADDVYALGRILHGLIGDDREADLRAIAGKAAAADERRRYPAVGDLLADLERWRERLPVSAQPATWRYRASRFVARHRVAVIATAAAIALLSATSIAALLSAREARASAAVAQQRFDDVRQLSRFMLTGLYDELGNAPGTVVARVRIAEVARRYLDRLAADGDSPRALRMEIAQGYERLARVQGVSGVASLGRPADALASLDRADALVRTLVAEAPRDPAANELAGTIALDRWTLAAENAASTDLNAAARAAYARALAIDPARPGARIGWLLTEKNRAFELIWTHDRPKDAIPVLTAALARLDRTAVPPARRDEGEQLRFQLLSRLGDARYYAGDVPGSVVAYRAAQAVVRKALVRRGSLAWLQRAGEAHWNVSGSLEQDRALALAEARSGVAVLRRVLSYGPDANAEKWLAILLNQEAQLLADAGDLAGAAGRALESVAIRERRARANPDDPRRARDLAIGLKGAADTLAKAERGDAACDLARRAVVRWAAIERRGTLGKADANKAYPEARAAAVRLCAA